MYARSTTMRGNPQSIDAVVAMCRDEVMPMVTQLDGSIGFSLLVDRHAGRTVATSAWETEEAMRASTDRVRESRDRVANTFGATGAEIREWQIAVLHRAHRVGDGACARVTWTRTGPGNLDAVVDAYRESLMPWWEQSDGFCSNSLLIDRRDGRCASAVVFESREAMGHTRDQFTTLREEFAQRMGMEILEVAEFDLALAHLRVPETV
jgi:heme-degrading monooxygenase HmoA